jgi:signal transduction histidine kinase
MELFAKSIADLYTRDYPSAVKHDMTCRLACKRMGASSVSILAYSGKEDNLVCRGRYIDPQVSSLQVEDNIELERILKNICVHEFIFAIKSEIYTESLDSLYKEFKSDPASGSKILVEEFENTLQDFSNWERVYRDYKSKISEEHYTFNKSTISGQYFIEVIEEKEPEIKCLDLDAASNDQKRMCLYNLKEDFGVTFEAQYYVAIPLYSNDRFFGLLRFLLPQNANCISINNSKPELSETVIQSFESISHIVSSHLEAHHLLSSNKKTYLSFKNWADTHSGLTDALSRQCEDLADIIESRGAIIRRWHPQREDYEIVGHSNSIKKYINFARKHNQDFFKQIDPEFKENKSKPQENDSESQGNGILGIHFNCGSNPIKIERYSHYKNISKSWHTSNTKTIEDKSTQEIFAKLGNLNLSNIAIIKIPDMKDCFIIFLNSDYRPFIKDDIKIIYPAIQNLSQEWQAFEKRGIESITEACNEMHQNIARVFDNRKQSKATLKSKGLTFIKSVEGAIKKVPLFSRHLLWQYVSEQLPDPLSQKSPDYYVRIISQTKITDPLFEDRLPERNKCEPLPLSKEQFDDLVLSYYNSNNNPKVKKIFKRLTLKGNYDYFDLPFYIEMENIDKSSPLVGIITFIYSKEYEYIVKEKRFFEYMHFFSKQISMAWKNFQEKIALEIQEKIDQEISEIDKNAAEASKEATNKIATHLADAFNCEVCLLYLEDTEQNSLVLSGSNIEDVPPFCYSLKKEEILTVKSYNHKKSFRIRGNERINEVASIEKLSSMENKIKPKVLQQLNKKEKKYEDTRVEHWLSVVLRVGNEKLGVIKLFRCTGIPGDQSNQTLPPPFSEIESNLLERIQSHIFNTIISFNAIQKRMEDMRNVLHQVISPLNALIGHSKNLVTDEIKEKKIVRKLMAINSLAKIASRYTRNFQTILELDLKKKKVDKKNLEDFGGFLENLIDDYQLLLEKKGIQIEVKYNRSKKIVASIDDELIEQAIFCILDNIIKYSLDKEKRVKVKNKFASVSAEFKEDVQVELSENAGNISLKFSNWGLAISEQERELLFSKSFRGQQAKKFGTGGGKGLGLYLVRKIAVIHGGIVVLDSFKNEHLFELKMKLPRQ